ncbi:MAG: hypothetical protein HYR85_26270 [Planctomycetes bacterium]|nr:hypothetical protein [Planctomycetota bacterium]MBI3845247.1 hypothetical protein [Planctomycetota bacterium]
MMSNVGGGLRSVEYLHSTGTGVALFVAGAFYRAGGTGAVRLAKWNGTSWRGVGFGSCFNLPESIWALRSFDDGSGPALYVAGSFDDVLVDGRCTASRGIARFNGHTWSAMPDGVFINALVVYAGGSRAALYAAGTFDFGRTIAKWNGTSWSPVGDPTQSNVHVMGVFDGGGGPQLYAGHDRGMTRWNGSVWTDTGDGIGIDGAVASVFATDVVGGPALYVGGYFTRVGHVATGRVARWDGQSWWALGSGITDCCNVQSFAVYDDGRGPALYVAGTFGAAGAITTSNIARWDGNTWEPLGPGLRVDPTWSQLGPSTMTVFDDGSGLALYVGGSFFLSGGTNLHGLARWNGTAWSSVGDLQTIVSALAVFDDGTGPALYAGNDGFSLGGQQVVALAKWDGVSWSPLPDQLDGHDGPVVRSFAVFDDGTGRALYVGGARLSHGGVSFDGVARWNGSAWSPVAPLIYGHSLGVVDDGTGPALYAGDLFLGPGSDYVPKGVQRLVNGEWLPLGSGTNNAVIGFTQFDDGTGPSLFAGGTFTTAGGSAAGHLARWKGGSVRNGNVNGALGPVTDVLFANDSAGDSNRVVTVIVHQPIDVRLDAAPAGPARARYGLWAWHDAPVQTTPLVARQYPIGYTVNPTPLTPTDLPQPFQCRSGGLGSALCRGMNNGASVPGRAPWRLALHRGIGQPGTLTIQALLEDRRAPNALGFSVSNAIVLDVR